MPRKRPTQRRRPKLSDLKPDDPRVRKFEQRTNAWLIRHGPATVAAARRYFDSTAKRLGVQAPHLGGVRVTNETFAIPLPLSIPVEWPRGKKLKAMAEVDRKLKAGECWPWKETSADTGKSRIVMMPLLPAEPKGKPGAPRHPQTDQIVADIRDRPYRTDGERSRDFERKGFTVSLSTIRRNRLKIEKPPK